MSRRIKLWEDPHSMGYNLYAKKSVTIKNGVTVLVGCNGIGKSTLLHNIRSVLKNADVPYIEFDNLHDGGSRSRDRAGFYGDIDFLATSMCSSEGENIVMNMGRIAGKIGNFIKKNPDNKELWILLDAIDSGLSIDNIVDIKELLFKTILEDKRNAEREIYIIVSANEYEIARGEQCLDVYNMKYVKFKDYEEYRKLILDSREWKNNREKVLAIEEEE